MPKIIKPQGLVGLSAFGNPDGKPRQTTSDTVEEVSLQNSSTRNRILSTNCSPRPETILVVLENRNQLCRSAASNLSVFLLTLLFASRIVIAPVKDAMVKDMRAASLARIFLDVEAGKR